MAKFNSVGQGGQYRVPEIPAPQGVDLGEELKQQGLEVPASVLPDKVAIPDMVVSPVEVTDYARSNAVADIPQNMQSQQSTGMYDGDQGTPTSDEGAWSKQTRYPDEGSPQMGILNARGMPMDIAQVQQLTEQNKREQQLKAKGLNVDWADENALEAAYPRSVMPTQRGTINRAARSVGDALLTTNTEIGTTNENGLAPYKMSAMQNIKQGLGVSATQAGSLSATAFAMVAPVLAGASNVAEGEIADPDSQDLHAWGSSVEGNDVAPVALTALAGGLTADTLYGLLGNSAMKLHQMGNVDSGGNATQPKPTNISSRVLGATVAQALIDKGYLVSDKTSGTEVFRLSPELGTQFYKASRAMSREVGDLSRGRSQTVPVTDTGEYIGASRGFRLGDKSKPNSRATKQMNEAKRVAGSIATLTSPMRSYFAALFTSQALAEIYPAPLEGQQSLQKNNSPSSMVAPFIQGMNSTKKLVGFKEGEDPQATKTKAGILLKLNNYYGQNIAEGSPRYAKHWEDYAVHRMYNDSEDINAQRDLMTRAVINGVSVPGKFDSLYHLTGIPNSVGQKHFDAIGRKVRNGDMSLTPDQREFAWYVTIGKVLEVGDTIGRDTNSLTAAGVASLVTPEFIAQAALIGRVLSSIVPQSNAAVAAVNLDLTKLQTTLSPQQLGVLNNFIGSSGSKNWGYRLQAYLDAANYQNAKKNGVAFTPRATVEIDMSSAGRTFLANDDGDIEVLSRVGILYNPNQSGALTNTIPDGNPRTYFLNVAYKQGVAKAISKDNPEVAEIWANLLESKTSPKFADDFGKGVLLQTDYGKPKSYHFDTARKFLVAYPEFRDELLQYYDTKGGLKALVKDLNSIFGSTLSAVIDSWQQQLPKDIVAVLGMVGKVPSPRGYWDEPMSIGSYMPKEDGSYTKLTNSQGNNVMIPGTRREVDPTAAARSKSVYDEETGEHKLLVPGPGTAAMNQVGPVLGQYRESVLVAKTMNYINGGKAPKDMLFMHPVFDNFVLTSDSLLQTVYVANNIALLDVLKWDIRANFLKDFSSQMKKAEAAFESMPEVVIGKNGPFYGITVAIDRQYGRIKDNEAKGWRIDDAQKDFVKYIESPASGFIIDKEGRSDNHSISSTQARNLVRSFMNTTMYDNKGKTRRLLIDVWANQGAINKKKKEDAIEARAAVGDIYFMF